MNRTVRFLLKTYTYVYNGSNYKICNINICTLHTLIIFRHVQLIFCTSSVVKTCKLSLRRCPETLNSYTTNVHNSFLCNFLLILWKFLLMKSFDWWGLNVQFYFFTSKVLYIFLWLTCQRLFLTISVYK